jgi:RNA polymerase sigma factor (sigma-70 family)
MGSPPCAIPSLTPDIIKNLLLAPRDEAPIEEQRKRAEITQWLWQLLRSSSKSESELAWELLFPFISHMVSSIARTVPKHDHHALLGEVLYRIFRHSGKFDPTKDLGPWVAKIVRNAMVDYHKAMKKARKTESISNFESTEAQASRVVQEQGAKDAGGTEAAAPSSTFRLCPSFLKKVFGSDQIPDRVREFLLSQPDGGKEILLSVVEELLGSAPFSDTDRTILMLMCSEELAAREAASKLGMTPGAVRVRKSRLLRKIRKILWKRLSTLSQAG